MTSKQPANKTKGSVNVQPQWLPWWRYLIWFFVILAFSWFWSNPGQNQPQRFSYTEFKDKVRANEVARVTLQEDRLRVACGKYGESIEGVWGWEIFILEIV